MEEVLYNGFNNGRDASDGVGGQPNPLDNQLKGFTKEEEKKLYLDISKKLQARHEQIKSEMIKILDASKILEDQYNELEVELYDVEQKYVDNLKNIID